MAAAQLLDMRTFLLLSTALATAGCGIDLTLVGPDGGFVLQTGTLLADAGLGGSGGVPAVADAGGPVNGSGSGKSGGNGSGPLSGAGGAGGSSPTGGSTNGSNGTSSSSGYPSGGHSAAAGGGGRPSELPLQVPSGGGAVLSAPKLVLVTFEGDAHRSDLEGAARWLMGGGYLSAAVGEYGVGSGSVAATPHLVQAPPEPQGVSSFLQARIDEGGLPWPDGQTLYVLALPHGGPTTPVFCASALGYHSAFYVKDAAGKVSIAVYAVVPDCSGDARQQEVTLSHEVAEAASDPTGNGYRLADPASPWTYLGGEVGDLCESHSAAVVDPSGHYSAQTIWSNAAARRGEIPCIPWPAGAAYRGLDAAPARAVAVAPGAQAAFTLTGVALGSAPLAGNSASWTVGVADALLGDFQPRAELSATSIAEGGQVTVTLSVPASATAGQHGAVWIYGQDSSSGATLGATVVAVAVR